MPGFPARPRSPPVHPHARGDNLVGGPLPAHDIGSPPRPWGQSDRRRVQRNRGRFTPTPVGTIALTDRDRTLLAVHPHARGDNKNAASTDYYCFGSPPRPWGQCWRGLGGRQALRFTPTPVGTIIKASRASRPAAVHPHARGDNTMLMQPSVTGAGSPPRPWGQFLGHAVGGVARRFTPTPVGTMPDMPRRRRSRSVHPHARGDNMPRERRSTDGRGSPPRPWGQCDHAGRQQWRPRFTPTPVGTMYRPGRRAASAAVHPHARGDNTARSRERPRAVGSPPRPWGQCEQPVGQPLVQRFTPTPVGTIVPSIVIPSSTAVHPHARGDNFKGVPEAAFVAGSPPRPWGQYSRPGCTGRVRRFTPTPVGTMQACQSRVGTSAVHPHARGDNRHSGGGGAGSGGSPPRPWGQLREKLTRAVKERFTPTPVGTICSRHSRSHRTPVHPHARGDNLRPLDAVGAQLGSPPRPWGQCTIGGHDQVRQRFTPTPVGTMPGAAKPRRS